MAKSELVYHKVQTVPISKVEVWDDVEARNLEPEGIKELADSIKEEGLQNPPVVQKTNNGKYKLIAGQRRLEALKRLGSQNIPVLIAKQPYAEEDAKAVSIIENLHRKQMKPNEMAQACEFLVKSMKSKRKAAKALGITPKTLRSYTGFSSVPEKIQELVPKTISRNEALRLYRIVPKVEDALEIANRIKRYSPDAKKRYLDALELDPLAPHGAIRRMANHFREKQNIRVKLTQNQAKLFAKAASDNSQEPNELAADIIQKWMSRRGYR